MRIKTDANQFQIEEDTLQDDADKQIENPFAEHEDMEVDEVFINIARIEDL